MFTKYATHFFTVWYVIGIATVVFASEPKLPCEISKERSLFSQFQDFVQNSEKYDLDSIDKFKTDYKKFVDEHLSRETCKAIYEFKAPSALESSYYYRYLCLRAGYPTTIPDFTVDHRAFLQTWGFLQHVLDQDVIKTHERYEEIKKFSAELGSQFTFRSKQLESPECKKTAEYRNRMKQLYTEFIQEQKYYTVLEDKLFFAKKHLGLCTTIQVSFPDHEKVCIKKEYAERKAALQPWYTKLRLIGSFFKRPLTEAFLKLKMQYRYVKYGEELERYCKANDHSKITDTLDNNVKMRRYTDYIQKKLDAIEDENKITQSSSKIWVQWFLSFVVVTQKAIPKHAKYKNQLAKYGAYFRLLHEKHANLIQPSGDANT